MKQTKSEFMQISEPAEVIFLSRKIGKHTLFCTRWHMPVTPAPALGRLNRNEKFEATGSYIRPVWVLLQDQSLKGGDGGGRREIEKERGRKEERERKHTFLKRLIMKPSRNATF